MSAREYPRCVAPLESENVDDERLCGEPATAERVVEGLACPLCAEHADELDNEIGVEPIN